MPRVECEVNDLVIARNLSTKNVPEREHKFKENHKEGGNACIRRAKQALLLTPFDNFVNPIKGEGQHLD